MAPIEWAASDVAVIGMAGRFPGAQNIQEFWHNLCAGVESIRFPDDHELEAMGVDPHALHDPHYVKAAAVMDGVELFDASFFGYTPREAELMDPQHRLFLECAWETLEHASCDPERYRGSIGVFGGGTTNTYLLYNLLSNREALDAWDPMQIDVSNGPDFVTTRVSYKLNLRGPSCTVQTACSTALVAIHMACQSLLNEECDMALAGGVSVHVKHPEGYWYLDGGNVSPDGHCRAFDAAAAGTIFGSGVAAVLLKRMDDAIADGDHIHAIVKGSAINNDGAGKVGFTAPSVEGQAGVITEALALAAVRAETVHYVETHGTATKLGDPIEIRALTRAFRTQTSERRFCAIGSVKTNIGHLASAAGAASFIKTVLMLQHQRIPPSLHFERPNLEIDFEGSPFYVNTELVAWPPTNTPRRAGVSSFGVGGTNAHVVLEEAPLPVPSGPSRPMHLLLLSAKTASALDAASANLVTHIRAQPELKLADVSYTLQVGRQEFAHRRMLVCSQVSEAAAWLESRAAQQVLSGVAATRDRPVVFMFPGMGDHYVNMGRELYDTEPTFRRHIDRCAELLRPVLKLDLREVLYPDRSASTQVIVADDGVDLRKLLRRSQEQPDSATQRLNQTYLAHPILFTIEYALAQLWIEWGVRPRAMVGYSIGEYVAACLAGIWSLEDGLLLIAKRAQIIQALPTGAMLAVLLPEADLQPWLSDSLALAAINTPLACVVSGVTDAVAELERMLTGAGIACQLIQTNHAFHSPMMAPIEEPLRALLRQIRFHAPTIPFFSNVTGAEITADQATNPEYWTRHMCQTVRFADALQTLLGAPNQVLLEMGSGQTLAAFAKQHPAYMPEQPVLTSLRQPHQQRSDVAMLLQTLGRLWLDGVTIDWDGFYAREQRQRVPLPTYPFERQRYWIGATTPSAALPAATGAARRSAISEWFYAASWQRSLLPAPWASLAQQMAPASAAETWLLFADDGDLAVELTKRLEQAGRMVIQVDGGNGFVRLGDGRYRLDPGKSDDYMALFDELQRQAIYPNRIVHCASITRDCPATLNSTAFRQNQAAGFYSLVLLAWALEQHGQAAALDLWVVSNYVCQVEDSDMLDPAKTTILSPCTVIPQEYQHITCHYLDISLTQPTARLAEQLLAEIQSDSSASVVAYRGRQRWVQRFEPVHLEADGPAAHPLRAQGVYLIIDGLVGVGWVIAQHLAQNVRARLVLIERAAENQTPQMIQRVQQLRQQGAEVLLLTGDSGDAAAMQDMLDQAVTHFGALHGVIYALGSANGTSFKPLSELGYADYEQELLPTLRSLTALAQTVSSWPLDFCMLTSSLSSALGGLGQAAHAAASLLIDSVAEQQSQISATPWLSVDWDVWQPEGELTAATVNAPLAQFAIAPADGVEAARRILTQMPASRIVISTGDLVTRQRQHTGPLVPASAHDVGALHALHPRPQLDSPYVAPRTELERTIMRNWQEVFGLEQIGIDDNFFELGGNSLIAIHTMSRLKKILHTEVPTAMLYQRPTIRFLAELLAQDEEQSAQDMAERLAKRKAELGRRQLVQRRK